MKEVNFSGRWFFVYESPSAFGYWVKTCRAARRISQKELASSVGVARETISNIENGKHNISLALFVTINDFFESNPVTK